VPLRLVEIQGDALFLYVPKTTDEDSWGRRARHVMQRLHGLLETFVRRAAELGAYSVCRCDACANIDHLNLKVVAHSGDALFSRVGDRQVLSGVDVIVAHRLLKNSVDADQYLLMTEKAFEDLPVPEGGRLEESVEEYDVGTFKTYVYHPELTVDLDEAALRGSFSDSNLAVRILRDEIQKEYTAVACTPDRGFHFNTGQRAADIVGYERPWTAPIPSDVLESFAGTGNPFSLGLLSRGEQVVDVGSGAGTDSLIAAGMVGPDGHVIGIDMTPAMLDKARAASDQIGLENVEFREGFSESLPVGDGWADVVISNGVVNLSPDKSLVFSEMFRVLRPGGRLQIADITVEHEVPEGAKKNIDLWTN